MPDRENVIRAVDSCFDYWLDQHTYLRPLELEKVRQRKADAIAMLKEKEAVKLIITPWLENEDGEVILEKRECGRCGYQFFTVRPNFCENCGTPILWEGGEVK